jgi:hypothetical protein
VAGVHRINAVVHHAIVCHHAVVHHAIVCHLGFRHRCDLRDERVGIIHDFLDNHGPRGVRSTRLVCHHTDIVDVDGPATLAVDFTSFSWTCSGI